MNMMDPILDELVSCDACHEPIDETEIGGQAGGIIVCRDCIDTADNADSDGGNRAEVVA